MFFVNLLLLSPLKFSHVFFTKCQDHGTIGYTWAPNERPIYNIDWDWNIIIILHIRFSGFCKVARDVH